MNALEHIELAEVLGATWRTVPDGAGCAGATYKTVLSFDAQGKLLHDKRLIKHIKQTRAAEIAASLPDYEGDLNVIHEAEQFLLRLEGIVGSTVEWEGGTQKTIWVDYMFYLQRHVLRDKKSKYPTHHDKLAFLRATASERTFALRQTLGLL